MKNILYCSLSILILLTLTACSIAVNGSAEAATSTAKSATSGEETDITTISSSSTAEAVLEGNEEIIENEMSYTWDESGVIPIVFSEDSISVNNEGVILNESQVTITHSGTYSLTGVLTDGQVKVETDDEDVVRLILNNVDLNCSSSSPLYISKAESVLIILADNTQNSISDGEQYVFDSTEEDEPNAALFSKADLTITGNGTLTVLGNYKDGIASKDTLLISGGNISVTAVDDGIRGKDYLAIKEGSITVNAGGDGLTSDNEEDSTKGFISITGGEFSIISAGDAISAQTDVIIRNGQFTLTSGAENVEQAEQTDSAKGIKGVVSVTIDGGTFSIDSSDDALHSNSDILITGGTFSITSGDDGLHADTSLTINGGKIDIVESYEGLESALITINGGEIHIAASDDGINVAGGADSSGMGQRPGPGGQPHPGQPQDTFTNSGNYFLYINGGYIFINAGGDGLDSNGSIEMTDGVVIVNGPTDNGNGPMDYMGTFNINGGTLIAVGSSGMAQAPSESSSQNSMLINLNSSLQGGSLIHLQTESGQEVLTFSVAKQVQSIAFSSPGLEQGVTYQLYYGGTSTGSVVDGLYESGVYSGGEMYTSLTISGTVTTVGSMGGRGGWR